MSSIRNARVVYAALPTHLPVPGEHIKYDTSHTIDLDTVPLDGGSLIKTLILSPDPYMRNKMRPADVVSYSEGYTLGSTLTGFGVGRVLRSEDPRFKQGDHVSGTIPWEEYSVQGPRSPIKAITDTLGLPLSAFVGAAGMPGKTAYYGLKAYSHLKKGETIFVSTAAGAVGAIVVQIAKRAGLKVIASSGSDEKAAYVKNELGADISFNYKTTDTRKVLQEHGPVDVYWDNVGGETLEAALENAAAEGRFIICGQSADYNAGPNKYPLKAFGNILHKRLTVTGFINHMTEAKLGAQPFIDEFVPLVAAGEIKTKEYVTKGLENAGQALVDMLDGKNFGKSIVIVAED